MMSSHYWRVSAVSLFALLFAAYCCAASPEGKRVLLRTIVLQMNGEGRAVTDAKYDNAFKEKNASAGVAAIIKKVRFSINGFPIPASEQEFFSKTPHGFLVNQEAWIYRDANTGQWRGGYKGQRTAKTYAEAALAAATGIVAGLEVRLYDTDHNGYADSIEADFLEGVMVNKVSRHSDKTYTIDRGEVDHSGQAPSEGRAFDGTRFARGSEEKFTSANFDVRIKSGVVALVWYGPTGWVAKRAKEVHGIFVDGADHRSYTIDQKTFGDAMRLSRDNLPISNRPGEFVNAQKYFGLNNNTEGLKVSLWFVPTTDPRKQGAPIGFTSGKSASGFLSKAIAQARRKLLSVKVSKDGMDIPSSQTWVTPGAHQQLEEAIKRAELVLAEKEASPETLDYQVYLLYLTLNGSADDIGARFGGFNYTGFDREIKKGHSAS